MNRRGFLGSILALGAAPAIVRADSLMRVVPRETTILTPEFKKSVFDGSIWTEKLAEKFASTKFGMTVQRDYDAELLPKEHWDGRVQIGRYEGFTFIISKTI